MPFIVRWPGQIKAATETDVAIIGTDIFSTILAVAGIETSTDCTICGLVFYPR